MKETTPDSKLEVVKSVEPHDKLRDTQERIELQALERRAMLEKIEDYLSFFALKTAGLILIVVGSIEILAPGTFHGALPSPMGILGVGFALLAGSKAADFLVKALDKNRKWHS